MRHGGWSLFIKSRQPSPGDRRSLLKGRARGVAAALRSSCVCVRCPARYAVRRTRSAAPRKLQPRFSCRVFKTPNHLSYPKPSVPFIPKTLCPRPVRAVKRAEAKRGDLGLFAVCAASASLFHPEGCRGCFMPPPRAVCGSHSGAATPRHISLRRNEHSRRCGRKVEE